MPTNSTAGEPRRILFLLTGAIGDVVRALPLLSRVRHAYPNAHIAWAVEPKSAPILERHPWLDELIVYDRHRVPWSLVPFLKRLRSGKFDLVLDLQRHLKSGLFSLLSGASDRLGFAKGNTKEFNHLFSTRQIEPQPNLTLKLTQYQAFGNALGIAPTSIEFGLAASEQEQSRADALLRDTPAPLLGVILGSSWPSRIYFPDSIAAVVSVLTRSNGSQPLFP